MIKKLKHITVICKELYAEKGASAVYDYVNEFIEKQDSTNISYRECTGCEASTPHWHSECLICGLTNTKPMSEAQMFAISMSDLLFQIRIESDAPYGDDACPVPQEYAEKIIDDPKHIPLIKKRIENSVLEAITANPDLYKREGNYGYEPDCFDHAMAVDAYVDEQHDEEFPVLKTVIVCDECGGTDVQSKGWVRPNKMNEFVDLMSEEIQDNFCDDCNINVSTSSIQVNIRDPKYIIK